MPKFEAITGDIVGSRFEGNNYKAKDFVLFMLNRELLMTVL